MTMTATTPVRPARRAWVRQTCGRPALRRVAYAALALPLAIGVVGTAVVGGGQAALGLDRLVRRRWLGDAGPLQARPGRLLAYGLVSVPLGCCALFILLLMVPNTVRNLLYPLASPTAADYADAWGGPTLAGAWAVHALIAIALVPVYLLVLRGVVGLQTRLREALLQDRSTWWAAPVTVVVIAGLGTFLVALLRQL